ncbi:MAG: hypothetical protein ACOC3V_04025 [bacterium]
MKIKRFEQISENKETHSDNEIYAFNLRMIDIRNIIKLIAGGYGLPVEDTKYLKEINLKIVKSHRNSGEYILINIPLVDKKGELSMYGFEIKIWEDGFISFENGVNVIMKMPNALNVYEILLNRMKK